MPSVMVESDFLDSGEWPSLGDTSKGGTTTSGGAAAAGTRKNAPLSGEGRDQDPDDWELLHPNSTTTRTMEATQPFHQSDVVVVEINPKLLRHSASSPDLRRYLLHDITEGDDDDDDEGTNNDAEASSYAMIAGPGSVVSLSSSSVSFRDAILARKCDHGTEPLSTSRDITFPAVEPRSEPRKPRVRPRFVVKPIRRCSKSTGDLQSLTEEENDDDLIGNTDASDFYHRKALGAKGRANGLKIRPDELKRKQFTLQKKEMQRQAQR